MEYCLRFIGFSLIIYLSVLPYIGQSYAEPAQASHKENPAIHSVYGGFKKRKYIDKNGYLSTKATFNQSIGFDPSGWVLAGPEIDALEKKMVGPYYESYGFYSAPRNYLTYDWGW